MEKNGLSTDSFDNPNALRINEARLAHLASLGLPVNGKTVLDAGCGVGHLARFFVDRGCRVLCVDGRAENIDRLRRKLPEVEARVMDLDTEPWTRLGSFDVVFCYGLLYHLENPLWALRQMGAVCNEILILESIITDSRLPLCRLVPESASSNQALSGIGSRPSPAFVAEGLRRAGFAGVYTARTLPDHPDFRFSPENDLNHKRDGHNLRSLFIASKKKLGNPLLAEWLPGKDHGNA